MRAAPAGGVAGWRRGWYARRVSAPAFAAHDVAFIRVAPVTRRLAAVASTRLALFQAEGAQPAPALLTSTYATRETGTA